jgi:hypothetical protein
MLFGLYNLAEEFDHTGSNEYAPAPKRVPWNKGELTGAKPRRASFVATMSPPSG